MKSFTLCCLLLVVSFGCTSTPAAKSLDTEAITFLAGLEESLSAGSVRVQESTARISQNVDVIAQEQKRIADAIEILTPKGNDSREEVIPSTESTSADPEPKESQSPIVPSSPADVPSFDDTSDYVVEFAAPWCGVCKTWETAELVKLKSKGVRVRKIDIDDPSNIKWKSKVTSLPTFWVVDGKTRTRKRQYVGYTSADVLSLPSVSVGSSDCGCSSACTCGCQSGGECQCKGVSAPVTGSLFPDNGDGRVISEPAYLGTVPRWQTYSRRSYSLSR